MPPTTQRSGKILLIIVLVLIVCGVLAYVYRDAVSNVFSPKEAVVLFDDVSPSEWYSFKGGKYHAIEAPSGEASVRAVFSTDESFEEALQRAETQETTITETEDGFEMTFTEPTTPYVAQPLSSQWSLEAIGAESNVSLGTGRSPRVSEGSVIALTPEGLVNIDLSTQERTTIITHGYADRIGNALSPDGTQVALMNSEGVLDLYSREVATNTLIYLGSITVAPGARVAFFSTTEVLVQTGENEFTSYAIPTGEELETARAVRTFVRTETP